MKTEQLSPFPLRLPPALKTWVAGRAHKNLRSVNAEIVQRLMASRQADQKSTKE